MADNITSRWNSLFAGDDDRPHKSYPKPSYSRRPYSYWSLLAPSSHTTFSFLATYPHQLHYTESRLRVFWSHQRPQNNSSSDDPEIPASWVVQDMIRSAFIKFNSEDDFHGLIQFWAPVKTGGRHNLTTSDQPFALANHNNDVFNYRSCCLKHRYNLDVKNIDGEEEAPMIISGAPSSAFLNQIPEFLPDLRVHPKSPLVSSALECGLMSSFLLPVSYQGFCVGVVECSQSWPCKLLKGFIHLNIALESVGFKTFHVRERLPFKTICGLECARDEINEALKNILQTHPVDFAQVLIPYEDEDHMTFMEDAQTERMLGLKLIGRCLVTDDEHLDRQYSRHLELYNHASDMLPLKIGLKNYKPHFLKNISKLSDNEPRRVLLSSSHGFPVECSCFVICLRSTEISDLDYVFEFLWRQSADHVMLLESLLLTLKRYLPKFKYALGAEVGDELHILDVENSTGSEIGSFKIFERNNLPSASKTLEKGGPVVKEGRLTHFKGKCKTSPITLSLENIQSQFGKTMIEAAKSLNVSLSTLKRKGKDLGISEWPRKDYLKRNVNLSYKNESNKNKGDKGAFQDPSANNKETYMNEHIVTIKAEYADDMIKFHLPISSATFVSIEKEIGKGFKLNPSNYKLKYLDEDGDWILLASDEDMTVCLKNWKILSSVVRLRLLPR